MKNKITKEYKITFDSTFGGICAVPMSVIF